MKKTNRIFAVLTALAISFGAAAPAVYSAPASLTASAAAAIPDEVCVEFRSHLVNRDTEFSVAIPRSCMSLDSVYGMISASFAETGSPKEGDYLRWNVKEFGFVISNDGRVNFTMSYNTTAAEEQAADRKVQEIIAGLDLGSGSEYDRIKAAYDYVKNNVIYPDTFSDSERYIFTAYGAAVKGKAVCQGYSLLLYRLLRELGVSCRAIPGTSGGVRHMWNIAAINGTYYLLDCTFDSTLGAVDNYFFLRGSEDFDIDFPDHVHVFTVEYDDDVFVSDYKDSGFTARYPISAYAYQPPTYTIGDVNGDGSVDSTDASAVLAAYAQLSTEGRTSLSPEQQRAADTDRNGSIDSADASSILAYYALASTGSSITPSEYFKG